MKLEKEINQSVPFTSEYQKLIVNLFFTNGWLEENMRGFLKNYDITKQQFNILRILRGSKTPLSTSSIRSRMVDKMSDTTRLINRMTKKGWVSKVTCEKDRRLVDIKISTAGQNLLLKIDKNISAMDDICKSISREEAMRLNRLLEKLREDK